MDRLRVILRADASIQIGTGHVMRCLTLADELTGVGAEIRFLCRDFKGHLGSLIEDRGYEVRMLPRPAETYEPADDETVEHAAWLGVDWRTDAAECSPLLEEFRPAWIVVDHYALDARWEEAARPAGSKILAIDDLFDRSHMADVLLDANLGRTPADYAGLVPEGCALLTGPAYALLRPEFRQARASALARRGQGWAAHLLVSLGGVDPSNATGKVLDALASIRPPGIERITVVLGQAGLWLEEVKAQAAEMPIPTEFVVNASNMAELMTAADLCIGAAGTTSWERCCLGLPTLVVIVADNQTTTAIALEVAGAALSAGRPRALDFAPKLKTLFERVTQSDEIRTMAQASSEILDGLGAKRVVAEILERMETRL